MVTGPMDNPNGGEELHYQRLMEDVHRGLAGDLYEGGGMWTSNTFTEDRLKAKYSDGIDDANPMRDVKLALVFGQEPNAEDLFAPRNYNQWEPNELTDIGREDKNPIDEAYISEDEPDFYDAATDGGDLDTFLDIADGDYKKWYEDTVDALRWQGYDDSEQMLADLANEAHTDEPYEGPDRSGWAPFQKLF